MLSLGSHKLETFQFPCLTNYMNITELYILFAVPLSHQSLAHFSNMVTDSTGRD